jgi:hypothetical protein
MRGLLMNPFSMKKIRLNDESVQLVKIYSTIINRLGG